MPRKNLPKGAKVHPDSNIDELPISLDSVLATEALFLRPSRAPDYKTENLALVGLAKELGKSSPLGLLQKLVDAALVLCRAQSAGISLLDEENGQKIFRWPAIAGDWAAHIGGTTPRDFSPCGIVVDRDAVQLFVRFDRFYPYFKLVTHPTQEGLLIPFHVDEKAVGTIWVVLHDESRKFDLEDYRLLNSLGTFASAAYSALSLFEQTAKMKETLIAKDRAKDIFLATLSHELRNPLAPLRNSVRILGMTTDPLTNTRAIDTIDRQVSSLASLVDVLLDVSRINEGKIELRRKKVDIASILDGALETSKPLMDAKGHCVLVENNLSEPGFLDGDPFRLQQVFTNLLNNAAKFTPKHGLIGLSVQQDGDNVRIKIKDNGIGIAPNLLPNIFDVFTQAETPPEVNHGGLGLGLSIAKSLVELHGGDIKVRS
ncbi:MAG: ATP-binding protein, partial [Betaproteobacteria bacterium]